MGKLQGRRKGDGTHIAVVGVHAVTVVEPLEGARDVHVKIVVTVLNAHKVVLSIIYNPLQILSYSGAAKDSQQGLTLAHTVSFKGYDL